MEATKTNTENVIDSAKISEKWLTTATEAMIEAYNKQLQFTTGLYDNFFNMLLENSKSRNERKNFSEAFLNSDLAKLSGTSFSDFSNNTNPFLFSFEGIYKQMLDYNRNLLGSIQNIKSKQVDWKAINEDYLKTVEAQIEASTKIGNSLYETFNKQMDLSIEANKKLMEERNIQLNSLIKQNQKFTTEFFKTQQTPTNVEEKKNKEASPNETKKKWEVPVTA